MLLILSFPLCIFSGSSDVQFSDSIFSFEDYPLQLNFRFSRSLLVLSNFIIELPGKIGIVYLISFLICKKKNAQDFIFLRILSFLFFTVFCCVDPVSGFFCQIFHNFTRNNQPGNGRHECHTARDGAALGTFVLRSRRANAVRPAAD